MNDSLASGAKDRLQRLDGYLREDPANPILLADACDTAIACGAHAQAEAYLASAERLGLPAGEWTFRRARVAIARRELDRAAALLQALRAASDPHPAVDHDLAYVRLLQGDFAGCRELLATWIDGTREAADAHDAMQVLWLRAMHRLQLLDEAWAWAQSRLAQGKLSPAAKGVASLVAVDLDAFEAARELADAALGVDPDHVEALVARGCVALAEGDAALATRHLERALQRHEDDGRIWSALGLASLYEGQLPLARSQLECAVVLMPDHIGTWLALGWTCLLLGDAAAARSAIGRALELDRNFAESHGALALVLALDGAREQAERHLELATRLDANNVTARYVRALLAGEASDIERVQALARKLLDRPGSFGRKLAEAVVACTRTRTRTRTPR